MIDYKILFYMFIAFVIIIIFSYFLDKQTDKGIKKLERMIRGNKRK